MPMQGSVPAVAETYETGGEQNAGLVRENVEIGQMSPAGKAEEITASNITEILSQDVMGTFHREFDITVPWIVFHAQALYKDNDEG